jgi:hypothetical protein
VKEGIYSILNTVARWAKSSRYGKQWHYRVYLLTNLKDLMDSNVIAFDLGRHYNRALALRTAQATDLILDMDSTQSDGVIDAISLSGKEISINR